MKIKEFFSKLSTFFLPIFCGVLGAMGGAADSDKSYRRVIIPFALGGFAYGRTENIFVFSIMSMVGALSLGYGIPDVDYLIDGNGDKGSFLGRFYYKLFKGNHKLADIATRGTIGKLIALSLISIPIINHNWLVYGICGEAIVLTNALISWRNFGTYKLGGKELSVVETITWGLITLFAILIIIIK
jgi:hypothetical protein